MGDLLTNFVYFTMAVYGFFSVGMISDAKVFYGAESPLCYFTVFDVSAEWFAKSCGIIIFFMIMSPFFAGVSYETYARISLPQNLLQLPIFIQCAFFSTTTGPDGCTSPYAMPFNMFIPQVALGVGLLVWNVMALKEVNGISMKQAPKDGATYFCWTMSLVYAVTFGSTLIIAPKYFWGPDSIFCYWEVNDESGVMFGRILGILMCSIYLAPLCEWARIEPALFPLPRVQIWCPPPLAEHAPLHLADAGLEYAKLAKMAMPMNIFFLSFFVKAAFFMESIGPGHNALLPINLWVLQIPLGLLFLFWNIKVLRDTKGATLLF